MQLVCYQSGRKLREATENEVEVSKASFRTGEFAGISPTENENGIFCAKHNGEERLCYVQ